MRPVPERPDGNRLARKRVGRCWPLPSFMRAYPTGLSASAELSLEREGPSSGTFAVTDGVTSATAW